VVSLQDAVSRWLLDDDAHDGLVGAMLAHSTDAPVISACLRSLQYIVETREIVERMESAVELARNVCVVMRSCDYDSKLPCRVRRSAAHQYPPPPRVRERGEAEGQAGARNQRVRGTLAEVGERKEAGVCVGGGGHWITVMDRLAYNTLV
jgi:hypothetical protein